MVVEKGYLLAMHRDIQKFQTEHPGIAFLEKGRTKDFYRDNAAMIDAINAKVGKLQQEYFVFTNDINPQVKHTPYIPAVEGKEAVEANEGNGFNAQEAIEAKPAVNPEPVMQEGKKYEDFEKEYDKLMQETVNVY